MKTKLGMKKLNWDLHPSTPTAKCHFKISSRNSERNFTLQRIGKFILDFFYKISLIEGKAYLKVG